MDKDTSAQLKFSVIIIDDGEEEVVNPFEKFVRETRKEIHNKFGSSLIMLWVIDVNMKDEINSDITFRI